MKTFAGNLCLLLAAFWWPSEAFSLIIPPALTSFTNPTPANSNFFGVSVAPLGNNVSLKWVALEARLNLQSGVPGRPTAWSNTGEPVSINGQINIVEQTMVATNRFFRLQRP